VKVLLIPPLLVVHCPVRLDELQCTVQIIQLL
jgi:hypothetical protein